MTTYYVKGATGNNANSGVDWANAVQTVAGALAKATPTIIYVDASETFTATAAITWTMPSGGTIAVISVTSGTTTWAAGAKEAIGSANNAFTIAPNAAGSSLFVYGMTIEGATGFQSSGTITIGTTGIANFTFETCTFNMPSTHWNSVYQLGSGSSKGSRLTFNNCTLQAKNVASDDILRIGGAEVLFTNLTLTFQANVPTHMIYGTPFSVASEGGSLTIMDSDLSAFSTASRYYYTVTNSTVKVTFKNCKLHSNITATSGTWAKSIGSFTIINCDSGDTINTFEYRNYAGTITEDAAIYKDSGAAFSGSGVSWKIVTTAACNEYNPFIVPSLFRWNTSTASTNFKVDFIVNSAGTALTDREIWLELGYPASTSTPNYTHASDRNANPYTGSGSDQTTSSATWTGATSPTKQYLDITGTPAEVGMIEAVVRVAKASATIYLDPQLQIT